MGDFVDLISECYIEAIEDKDEVNLWSKADESRLLDMLRGADEV
jgi:hypothetical protein